MLFRDNAALFFFGLDLLIITVFHTSLLWGFRPLSSMVLQFKKYAMCLFWGTDWWWKLAHLGKAELLVWGYNDSSEGPTRRAGMCFTLALVVDKTLLNAEQRLQSFEGTLEGHYCSIWSVVVLGTKKGALIHQQLGLQEILPTGFSGFSRWQKLCKVSGQFWGSRVRNCTTSQFQKKYPQKERVRETSGTTEMAIV